ncbi:LysM peptidoglycan-binding domain-containing protein [Clostridium sp. DJ247]|uniref:LysM peptidoglycan-binding domain-containing protein n=1 Tax=Clostridium sp. DJ247 TaxID=2726188 RepID=UPI0016291CC1|nr:LysM peptidoglycan-binding domain-containing protein [Clostridium sp. DJ247]MBC2579701.1 LysM peptidoglycan-binding domain-containing protein [Clostridium sp. DJ247]
MWYVVQPGDCLYMISLRFGVCIRELLKLNSMRSDTLYVGQKLFIPLSYSRALVTYTVKSGDTLDSIAQNFNTTKQAIMQLNNMSNDIIVPGQKMKIEPGSRHSRAITTYVVKTGDTLDSIAQKFNITKQAIMQLNNLYSDLIVPGQELRIETRSDIPYTKFRPAATYTVEVGDTLDSIAEKFNTTKQAIMQLNNLASENIKAGQTLTIEVRGERFRETIAPTQNHVTINNKREFFSIYDFGLNKTIKVFKELGQEGIFFFVSKMSVTAAGSPKAYHNDNELALEFLDNAGRDGYWWGLVTDQSGIPLIQGIKDPAPGYYISKTALSDCSKSQDDPTRYVDAAGIPYIALPAHHMMDAKLGDLCVVINTLNSKIGYAIIADVGPDDSLGIGSIALAEDIGIVSSPKIGGAEDGILYIVFSQSGEGWCKLKTREQVINEAQWLFKQWGGIEKVHALFNKFPLSYTSIQ